ncbi:MAG: hypothetical protein U0939_07110 [Pirellulales bacterium]
MSCRLLSSLKQLRRDERGDVSPITMILMTTIAVLGIIVGLATVRDYVVQEMGDVAVALDHVNQSFSVEIDIDGTDVYTASYSDPGTPLEDEDGLAPACLNLSAAPVAEGDPILPAPAGTIP